MIILSENNQNHLDVLYRFVRGRLWRTAWLWPACQRPPPPPGSVRPPRHFSRLLQRGFYLRQKIMSRDFRPSFFTIGTYPGTPRNPTPRCTWNCESVFVFVFLFSWLRGVHDTGESNSAVSFTYLVGKIEIELENVLTCLSDVQMGSNH